MPLKNFKVLAYNQNSESSNALAKALGIPRLRHEGSTLKGNSKIFIINWGSSKKVSDEFDKCSWINHYRDVSVASNKLSLFKSMPTFEHFVPWTDSDDVVKEWLLEGKTCFARTKLNSHSGSGIVEMDPNNPDTWEKAQLYTKYVPKESEFRVHFMNGEIFDVQKKAARSDVNKEDINWKIRSHDNGFVFIRDFGDLPEVVSGAALSFIQQSSLLFGAIDIIYNRRNNQAFVLEVNTAPGLTGTTVEKYKEAFERNFG